MGYNPIDGSHAKTPKEIDDLVRGTQELIIKRGELVNLMTDLTDYIGVNQLFKRHEKRFDGGLDWRFDVITDHNHTARFTKLYANDTANHVDATKKGTVSPRFIDASYVYDVRERELQSNNAIDVYNFVKAKMAQMYQSWYDLLEGAIWTGPQYSSDDVTPFGIQYWITKMSNSDFASHADGGFYGKNPVLAKSSADPTTEEVKRAGIADADISRWRNYCCQYSAVSSEDLVARMRRAVRAVDFRSPVTQITDPSLGGSGRGVYVNLDTIGALEKILEAQNMNLGNDLASKDGKCMFKGHEVVYAPYLNDDATDPVYLINWKTLALGILSGWKEKLSEPIKVPNQHNARQVFLDGGLNMICTNLRTQAVIHKALAD